MKVYVLNNSDIYGDVCFIVTVSESITAHLKKPSSLSLERENHFRIMRVFPSSVQQKPMGLHSEARTSLFLLFTVDLPYFSAFQT